MNQLISFVEIVISVREKCIIYVWSHYFRKPNLFFPVLRKNVNSIRFVQHVRRHPNHYRAVRIVFLQIRESPSKFRQKNKHIYPCQLVARARIRTGRQRISRPRTMPTTVSKIPKMYNSIGDPYYYFTFPVILYYYIRRRPEWGAKERFKIKVDRVPGF